MSESGSKVEEGDTCVDAQARKASTILWSRAVMLKFLPEVRSVTGDIKVPSNVKDAKP